MLSFFKNIFKNNSSSDVEEKQSKNQSSNNYNKEELEQEFILLKEQIKKAKDIDTLNKLGSICMKLEKIDEAIKYYEESLSMKPTLGKASTDLLKLYNIKRKEASIAKDDKLIQFYLDKIDNLMKLNKETMKKTSTY